MTTPLKSKSVTAKMRGNNNIAAVEQSLGLAVSFKDYLEPRESVEQGTMSILCSGSSKNPLQ